MLQLLQINRKNKCNSIIIYVMFSLLKIIIKVKHSIIILIQFVIIIVFTTNKNASSKIVFDVLNGLAIKKKIQLIDAVPEENKVFADINMVTSVIQNLVSNALKFTHMDGSGVVKISAEVTSKGVEIAIQDTGLGMTSQQIEQLFQPRLTVSFKGTDGEKGMGLGLVLCKRFVEINQGEIQVQSKEGEGTLFKVTLPQAESYLALSQNQKKKEISS